MCHLSSPNVVVDRDAASLPLALLSPSFGGIVPISGHTKLWLCHAQALPLLSESTDQNPRAVGIPFSSTQYDQLKLQTLELWCRQQQKLGNLPASAADQYQIMREDHDLGIDAFMAEAMRLSPNVTSTQALRLLQACI